MRGCLLVAVLAALAVTSSAAESASTRSSSTAAHTPLRAQNSIGCCSDPGVVDFGRRLDFTAMEEDSQLTDQYHSWGILLGRGASSLAPRTYVRADYARASECNHVLNGDPTFSGWEFMIFADPSETHWASVQNVGANVGYCDLPQSCFLAVYDYDGNLLDIAFNQNVGFEFLSIERPQADIYSVMVGDCLRSGNVCYPDQAGSALNCLTFSLPVNSTRPLPTTVPVPPSPTVATTPATAPLPLVVTAVLLGFAAVWYLRRERRYSRAD